METNPGTVTLWQSGRLAPRPGPRHRLEFTREHWVVAGLAVLAVLLLTAYVMLLQREMDRSELAHAAQRSRAVAEAQCEADAPADRRGRCVALFDGDVADAQASPAAPVQDGLPATTVSLASTLR